MTAERETVEAPAEETKTKKVKLGASYWKLWSASVTSNLGDGVAAIAYPWLASAVTRSGMLLALIAVYWDTVTKVVWSWEAYPSYSHGYLIVPILVYVIWTRREELWPDSGIPLPADGGAEPRKILPPDCYWCVIGFCLSQRSQVDDLGWWISRLPSHCGTRPSVICAKVIPPPMMPIRR